MTFAATGVEVLRPDDEGYAAATRLWNAAAANRPAAVARCRGAGDVHTTIESARDNGLAVSVLAGGHDWAGRALVDGGVVVDLSGMRGVVVDAAARTATAEGGALAGDLLRAAAPHGLATATGTVRGVGMAGLTMGGGYGPLCGRFGLALDNLLRAEVVLADGRQVTADADTEIDLFWALRGGGGNFGVATSLTFRLHPLPAVLGGMLAFPLAQARQVLRGYREVVAAAPDELTVMAGFLSAPDGSVVLFLCPFWSGPDLSTGEPFVKHLAKLGDPVLGNVGRASYHDALNLFDGAMFEGNRYFLRTRWLPSLVDEALDALVDAASRITSPFSAIALHHFHGAASRVGPADTAFGLRADHLQAEVIAAWPPGDDGALHREWAAGVSAALAPVALPGGYPNLLGPEEPERVAPSYGANYPRLLIAKSRYDPANVFASAVPTLPLPRTLPVDPDGAEFRAWFAAQPVPPS